MTALEEVFEMWLITCGLWPPRSPDLNLYCLWQTLENIVHVNYPQSLQELKDNIERKVMNIFRQEPFYM